MEIRPPRFYNINDSPVRSAEDARRIYQYQTTGQWQYDPVGNNFNSQRAIIEAPVDARNAINAHLRGKGLQPMYPEVKPQRYTHADFNAMPTPGDQGLPPRRPRRLLKTLRHTIQEFPDAVRRGLPVPAWDNFKPPAHWTDEMARMAMPDVPMPHLSSPVPTSVVNNASRFAPLRSFGRTVGRFAGPVGVGLEVLGMLGMKHHGIPATPPTFAHMYGQQGMRTPEQIHQENMQRMTYR